SIGTLPLSRFTVLDLTHARAGPTAVRQLADWGANVIKIEPRGDSRDVTGSRREGFDFQNLHRNKRSLTLNLKTPEGKAIFMKLAEKADVIVEGMGGLMSITGLPGQGPVRVGIPIDDLCAGLLLGQAIIMALIEREQSGEGQWVHTSLLEAQIFMLDFQASRWLIAGEVAKQ